MKIEINKNKLIKSLSKADKVVSKNSTLPVLACVLFEVSKDSFFIKATNLEVGLKIKVPAKIINEGVCAVPSGLITSYVNNLGSDEDLVIEQKDNLLFISGERSETKINTLPVDDFPSIPDTCDVEGYKIHSKELIEGFKGVWYASSVSSVKPELSSVYVYQNSGELIFVATDSFRLAEKKVKTKIDIFDSVIVPQKNVLEIIRIFEDLDEDVVLKTGEDKISVETENIYLITRVIDGNFPDYKQIIPKESKTTVNLLKNDLQNVLKISNLFSNNFNQIDFKIDSLNDTFEVLSKNSEKGENRNILKGKIEGESLDISFNQKYISDCFNSIDSENIELVFNGSGKPLIIKSVKDGSFQYLVMPLNK